MRADLLNVVTVISNPMRYRSRYELYRRFKHHMHKSGVRLITVELAFGHRPHEVTEACNPDDLQLRTHDELWHKENLINLGIQHLTRLHPGWQYLAWIDADVHFFKHNWAEETVHALQHYDVIQPWSRAVDLGPKGEPIGHAKSFVSCYLDNEYPPGGGGASGSAAPNGYWHSGYAWAARRSALDTVGHLIDCAVLGSADFYMAWGLINRLDKNLYNDVASLPARKKGFTQGYLDALFGWQDRAKALQKNIGYVEGTILHEWHGKKKQRQYNTRENILIYNNYDPHLDLTRDSHGVIHLTRRNPRLRDEIRAYFRQRSEDSIDM